MFSTLYNFVEDNVDEAGPSVRAAFLCEAWQFSSWSPVCQIAAQRDKCLPLDSSSHIWLHDLPLNSNANFFIDMFQESLIILYH